MTHSCQKEALTLYSYLMLLKLIKGTIPRKELPTIFHACKSKVKLRVRRNQNATQQRAPCWCVSMGFRKKRQCSCTFLEKVNFQPLVSNSLPSCYSIITSWHNQKMFVSWGFHWITLLTGANVATTPQRVSHGNWRWRKSCELHSKESHTYLRDSCVAFYVHYPRYQQSFQLQTSPIHHTGQFIHWSLAEWQRTTTASYRQYGISPGMRFCAHGV